MKKIIYLLTVVVLTLTSCNTEENPLEPGDPIETPANPNGTLVKKVINTETGAPAETTLYTYNGNKLIRADYSDDSFALTAYVGSLVKGIEYYNETSVLAGTETFTYGANNKLASYIYISYEVDSGSKEEYTHNGDGTITVNRYIGDAASQTTLSRISKIFFYADGEVQKIENYSPLMVLTSTDTFTYDGKNSPYKNVAGYSEISFIDGMPEGRFQNLVNDNRFNETIVNGYVYNANLYPTTQTSKDENGDVLSTTQFFYE